MVDSLILKLDPPVRGVILDMDGVLWRDTQAIVDIPWILETFQANHIKVSFATNNATKSVEQYQKKLREFGAEVQSWQIINSSMATSQLLLERFPSGGPIYIIGEESLVKHLANNGFYISEETAVAVIVGLDTNISFAKLRKANSLIRHGAIFIGTNPDLTYPTPEGLGPGSGAIIAAVEAASGVKPIIAGKPQPTMMQIAMRRMNTTPQDTLVIGDRLETDILGGQRAGCRTALVLSGVTALEDAQKWSPPPNLIVPDLRSLLV